MILGLLRVKFIKQNSRKLLYILIHGFCQFGFDEKNNFLVQRITDFGPKLFQEFLLKPHDTVKVESNQELIALLRQNLQHIS